MKLKNSRKLIRLVCIIGVIIGIFIIATIILDVQFKDICPVNTLIDYNRS